jgi:cellobiose transport system substrate-binding protein
VKPISRKKINLSKNHQNSRATVAQQLPESSTTKKAKHMKKLIFRVAATAAALGLPLSMVAPAQATPPAVTLSIWAYGNVIEQQGIDDYKKIHPEITIDVKKSGLDPHHQSLITSFLANKTPDIAAVEVSYSGYFRSYPQYFTDLRKAPYNSGSIQSDYLSWRWAQGVGFDGTVFGIPTDVGGMEVAYRTDLFKAHGLPTDRVKVGKLWPTWDAFFATGQKYMSKLTKAEKDACTKKKICAGFIDDAATVYGAVLNQGTEKYYQNDGTKDGKLIFKTSPSWELSSPQVKKAFTTTANALASGVGANAAAFSNNWNAGALKGTFATVLAPAWMMDYIKQTVPKQKGKWDIATLPGGGGNLGGSQLTIPKAASHKSQAWDFIKWYLSPAEQLAIFKKYGLFPSTSVLYDQPALKNYKDPYFNNAPVGAIYGSSVKTLRPIYEGKKERAIDNIIGQALSRVGLKKQSAAAAWTQAMNEIKNAVG